MTNEEDKFSYKRKVYVKGLFNAKGILSCFENLEFETLKTFFTFLYRGYRTVTTHLAPTKTYSVHIKSVEEFNMFYDIVDEIESTYEDNEKKTLKYEAKIPADLTTDILKSLRNRKFITNFILNFTSEGLLASTDFLSKHRDDSFMAYLRNTVSRVRLEWNGTREYGKETEELIRFLIQFPEFRMIDFSIDYESFLNHNFSDMKKLRFYWDYLNMWFLGSYQWPNALPSTEAASNVKGNITMVFNHSNSPVKGFFNSNMDLYLSEKDAKENLNMVFSFTDESIDSKNGEDIPMKDLNNIRRIVDIKFDHYQRFSIPKIIDLSQNIRIMKDPYMIPDMCLLLQAWTSTGVKN